VQQRKRRRQHYPRLIPVRCAFVIASASSSSLAGISGFSRRPLSLTIPEASSPICVSASPFLHANVLEAHSSALPPQLPWRNHPLPACACAHSIVDAQHHSPRVGQAVVSHRCPSVAHLAHGTHAPSFPVVASCCRFAASAPSLAARS
jgi:hypothetical protein